MPSATATDLVTTALRLLGVIDPIQTPEAEDLRDGFADLNGWIDELGTQRQTIYYVARTVYNMVSAQESYTVGVGGNCNQARPLWIEGVGILPTPSVTPVWEIPLGPPMTLEQWRGIGQKASAGSYPRGTFYDYNWSAGLARLYVWPVPNSSTPDLVLYTPTALTEFADLTTSYTFPPGYKSTIEKSLAVAMQGRYPGVTLHPSVEKQAELGMANIKRANHRPALLSFDGTLLAMHGHRGRGNIQTGQA